MLMWIHFVETITEVPTGSARGLVTEQCGYILSCSGGNWPVSWKWVHLAVTKLIGDLWPAFSLIKEPGDQRWLPTGDKKLQQIEQRMYPHM